MNKIIEKTIVYILAFFIGIVTGGFIAYEMIQKKISEKNLRFVKEVNKVV